MTVENIKTSIYDALYPKSDEPVPRVSKKEAQQIIKAAEQGAGPDPLAESIYVAVFAVGSDDPVFCEMIRGLDITLPEFGKPGTDYLIDDEAMKLFNAFFSKYAVPLGTAREKIIEELKEQILNRGKNRKEPSGVFYKVHFNDFHDDPWIGHIDAKAKVFYLEEPGKGKRGESLFYGAYNLDKQLDPARK